MPKMKTHRGAAKRFKRTGTGKLMRRKGYLNHILEKKSPRRKRRLSGRPRSPARTPSTSAANSASEPAPSRATSRSRRALIVLFPERSF